MPTDMSGRSTSDGGGEAIRSCPVEIECWGTVPGFLCSRVAVQLGLVACMPRRGEGKRKWGSMVVEGFSAYGSCYLNSYGLMTNRRFG